jgi:hypothetical protein
MAKVDACLVLLMVGVLWITWMGQRRRAGGDGGCAAKIGRARLLRPRTPVDCLLCRQQEGGPSPIVLPPLVHPWRERKSCRGRPKRVPTVGFACQEPPCRSRGIIDEQVHALVGDGTNGRQERTQTFRCQACGATFSARRDTGEH